MNRLTKAAVVALALSTTAVPMLVQAQDRDRREYRQDRRDDRRDFRQERREDRRDWRDGRYDSRQDYRRDRRDPRSPRR